MVEAYLSQFWRLRVQEQGKAHLVLGEDLIPSLQRPPSQGVLVAFPRCARSLFLFL